MPSMDGFEDVSQTVQIGSLGKLEGARYGCALSRDQILG
jgi:hypothetical protein